MYVYFCHPDIHVSVYLCSVQIFMYHMQILFDTRNWSFTCDHSDD